MNVVQDHPIMLCAECGRMLIPDARFSFEDIRDQGFNVLRHPYTSNCSQSNKTVKVPISTLTLQEYP